MTLRFAMVAALLMVCMPIGGLTASGPVGENHHIVATAEPVEQPWLVAPPRLLFLCAVMYLMARIDHRRAVQSRRSADVAEE